MTQYQLDYLQDVDKGATSAPCCMTEPIVNQKLLAKPNWFSNSSGSSMQGYGLSHSYGDNLANKNKTRDTQMYAEKRLDNSFGSIRYYNTW